MLIALEEYKRLLRRAFFRDCAVRSRNVFMFIRETSLTDAELAEEEEGATTPICAQRELLRTFVACRNSSLETNGLSVRNMAGKPSFWVLP